MTSKIIKHNRGGIFALGVVLAMVIFMSTAWYSFSLTNKKLISNLQFMEDSNIFYDDIDRFYFYLEQSIDLAIYQSFYQISKEGAIDKTGFCKIDAQRNVVIWDEKCKPTIDYLHQKFLTEFNKSFNSLISIYSDTRFITPYFSAFDETGNNLYVKTPPGLVSFEGNSPFMNYSLAHNLREEYVINLTEKRIFLEDFVDIYTLLIKEKQKCKDSCFDTVTFERWDYVFEKQDERYYFEFKTKNYFLFYEDNQMKYAPIKLNFLLE